MENNFDKNIKKKSVKNRIIIFILIILIMAAFGAGVYFKDDIIKLYDGFSKQVQDFQKTNLGSVVVKTGKKILSPPPLNAGGSDNKVVLLQSKIISETNLQRQENGNLPGLRENTKLDEAALAKANDLFKNQYFEHMSPTGVDPGELVQSYGYDYIVAGENLILGNFLSEKEVVQDWMNSPGHRANILNNRYTEIGVAVVKGTYKGESVWISVQEFGFPLSACNEPSANLKNQIDSNNAQLNILSSEIDDRKKQIEDTNQRSAAYEKMVEDYNQLVDQYNSLADATKSIIANYNEEVNIFNNCVAGK